MSFEPRFYQTAAVCSVIDAHKAGKRQLLLRLPTGAGKTVISALLIEKLLPLLGSQRILFLAHRREIIDQTAEKIGRQIGESQVTVEQAERKAQASARVVVASVQTLAGRLQEYPPEAFGALIVDECHHAYAKTWMDVISHFGSQRETLLLGLTATPKRTDGRCVGELFKETAFEISLSELQEQGFLVPMDYYTIEASLGLGELSLDQGGDFQATLLGKIMNSPEVRELTIRACLQRARSQKIIAFCASVEHARDLAADFEARGIRAAYISGETQDRTGVIEEFRSGKIRFLSNYGVLTEGFDDPSIECVLLARPTTSPLIYSQCLGRGLRSHPGKRVCTVIDIVDRQRQQLQYNAFEAAGLKRSWRGSGKDPLREAAAIARIRVSDPSAFLKLRNALSLHETHDILMGLDPRLVFAGIDGMPLVRYQRVAQGTTLKAEQCADIAHKVLRDSGAEQPVVRLDEGDILVSLNGDMEGKVSPYLAWHLEQATGWNVRLEFIQQAPLSASLNEVEEAELESISIPEAAESQLEFEYVRDDFLDSWETTVLDELPLDTEHALNHVPSEPQKRSMGLKDRLDSIVRKSQSSQTAAHSADKAGEARPNQEPRKSGAAGKTSGKGLTIQERMRAIKSESLSG